MHEEFNNDNESIGWILGSGYHPRDVEVFFKNDMLTNRNICDKLHHAQQYGDSNV